jgi:hypothetical protein
MFGMVNVDMIFFVIKEKLNEILTGQPIDGFKIVSNDENTIVLRPEQSFTDQDIQEIKGKISIKYKQKNIVIEL